MNSPPPVATSSEAVGLGLMVVVLTALAVSRAVMKGLKAFCAFREQESNSHDIAEVALPTPLTRHVWFRNKGHVTVQRQ